MSLKPFTCPDCGETFMLKPNGNRKRCPDCAAKAFRRQVYEYQKRKRQEKREGKEKQTEKAKPVKNRAKPQKPVSNMQAISELAAAARREGLTYGQYAAGQYLPRKMR